MSTYLPLLRSLKKPLFRHFPRLADVTNGLACRALMSSTFIYRYHRRLDSLDVVVAHSNNPPVGEDANLMARLVASYSLRTEAPSGQWSAIFDRHGDIHAAIMGNDRGRIEEILRNPATSDLMYGFENNAKSLHRNKRIEDGHAPKLTLDALICLAEGIAARPTDNPECYLFGPTRPNIDEVISEIESVFQFQLLIPNPFPLECGSVCCRGIISYRVPQAIYQAWRISQLVRGIANPKVLEIGGGLGRTALYARQFGITDYTIIDIPVSSLAQGNFLGRVLGDREISLFGESGSSTSQIKILPPGSFLEGSERYDVVLNADSLTEIGQVAAQQYWSAIQARADIFLSINHEANEFTVASLIKETRGVAHHSRHPYWMRRGYVEEVCTF